MNPRWIPCSLSNGPRPVFRLALAACLVVSMISMVSTPLAVQGQSASKTLVVDDFEDGDLEAGSGLSWVAFSDDQFGGTSQARIEVIEKGAESSRRALRLSGTTTPETERRLAAVWVPVAKEGLPKDLSAYDGIRFYARGDGQTYRAGLRRGRARLSNYTYNFVAPEEWIRIEVPYSELVKNAQGAAAESWTPEDISWLGFSVPTEFVGTFALEVDSIEFYRRPQTGDAKEQGAKEQGAKEQGEAR